MNNEIVFPLRKLCNTLIIKVRIVLFAMTIQLVIFDWSGPISDDRRPVYEADMAILRKYRKPAAPFEEWVGSQAPFQRIRIFFYEN